MLRNGSLTVIAALAGAIARAVRRRAAQEDCPRGTLDKAYCDRNGDLTADLPTDPKKIVNPSTLIFSYTPVEDPAVYQKAWDGFLKHLEKVTGKKVVFFPVQSNAAQYEAMRSGRLHIAGVNAGGNALAVNCAGFVPFAMMAAPGQQLRLRDGNHRAGRQPDQDAGRSQGPQDRVHRRDLELRLQGAVGDPQGRLQSRGQARLRAGVLRQARQLDPRRRQQGLRGGGGGQFGAQPHDRPQGVRPGEDPLDLQVARHSRPPATATPTTSIRSWSRRSRRPSSTSPGRARRCRPSSRRKASSSRSTTRRTGPCCARSTRPPASNTLASRLSDCQRGRGACFGSRVW